MIKTHLPSFHVIQKQQRFFFSISECVLGLQEKNSAPWLLDKDLGGHQCEHVLARVSLNIFCY